MGTTTPEPVVETAEQYGIQYPNDSIAWDVSPFGVTSGIATETGRAKAQDAYKSRVESLDILPGASNRLRFVTRTITTAYSTPKAIV